MKTSRTFFSLRRGDSAVVPFLAVVDIAPDVLATALLELVAVFLLALTFIFAARRPSPNHKLLLDLLARMPAQTAEPAGQDRTSEIPSHAA